MPDCFHFCPFLYPHCWLIISQESALLFNIWLFSSPFGCRGVKKDFNCPCLSFHTKWITWLPILLFAFCRGLDLDRSLTLSFVHHLLSWPTFLVLCMRNAFYFVNNRKQKSFSLITLPLQFSLAQLIVTEKFALWHSIMNCINCYFKVFW